MYTTGLKDRSLKEYRSSEADLHIELMNICRKYMSKLGIISIMGILDIVKQETIELEKATRKSVKNTEFGLDDNVSDRKFQNETPNEIQ
jgi:hypothetical protein